MNLLTVIRAGFRLLFAQARDDLDQWRARRKAKTNG